MIISQAIVVILFLAASPFLLGSIPEVAMASVLIAIFSAFLGVRLKRRIGKARSALRYGLFSLSLYLTVAPLLGFAGGRAHQAWMAGLRRSACGVVAGMTREQAKMVVVQTCGANVRESDDGFVLQPRGLARLYVLDDNLYEVQVQFDKDGKVLKAEGLVED